MLDQALDYFSLDHFMTRAVFAGFMVALMSAPLGCFIVWRRMAYFGEATAHASILGVALALAFSWSVMGGVLLVCLGMALFVVLLTQRGQGLDITLGVLSHSALALGLVIASLLPAIRPDIRIDLMAYLFGDILAVSWTDLIVIFTGLVCVSCLMLWRWRGLLLTTISPVLARASGFSPYGERVILLCALALVIALSIEIMGILLIVALLIIPPAASRFISRTPESMLFYAALIGMLSVGLGLALSLAMDTPAGPTIICVAAGSFLCLFILSALHIFFQGFSQE